MNPRTIIAVAAILLAVQGPAVHADPKSNIIVINVLGQVNKPARIALPAGSTLMDAVAATGGLTKLARQNRVLVIHKTLSGRPISIRVDMRRILNGEIRDLRLRDGDTVVVPESPY